MASRGGRDIYRRDYPSRSEEKSHNGRSTAPPSRHLWVGNLPHNLPENTLTNQFLRFGELESVAFQPGRSYAFINYKNEEEAFAAVRALRGYVLAGNALRIEFAKADKPSTISRDEDYLERRDEPRFGARGSLPSHKESRTRHFSPDPSYSEKSNMTDKNAEPSEVLWIGFPASLKVDDVILRKAFSPFGEIEKITAFPGRSYAFVRYKSIMSACRAKENLQGKLFGNPRVHICFAKNESGASNTGGRVSSNAPLSPHFKSYGRPGSSENYWPDRKLGNNFHGDPTVRSPRIEEPDDMDFGRKGDLWTGRRFREPGSELGSGLVESLHERRGSSPPRDNNNRGIQFRNFSPQQFSRKHSLHDDDPWDLPEDELIFQGAKKLKTGPFCPENELPEYPLSNLRQQQKKVDPRLYSTNIPIPEGGFDKNKLRPFGYEQFPDRTMNMLTPQPYGDGNDDNWNGSQDSFQVVGSGRPSNPRVERKRSTPEFHPQSSSSSSTGEWKWEGTIAKGGNPVCRARCFPVGKLLDMMLPETLDCTARTGLDMLAKHYYQSTSAWVVFFVPQSDADIGYYNEFMHYLGEKQRAAVAKLDEKTTLFLVPPSEFSEKVLKVPGKLSISGVILKLEQPGPTLGSNYHPQDNIFLGKSEVNNNIPNSGMMSYPELNNMNRHEYMLHQRNPRSPRPNSGGDQIMPRGYEPSSSSYSAKPPPSLQPEQLAQLASSLFGQPRQSGSNNPAFSTSEDFRQLSTGGNSSDNLYRNIQLYGLQNNQGSSDISTSQFDHQQQHQQQPQHHQQHQSGPQGNAQIQNTGIQDDVDADPQKRLQATLQLAAALLQQIQQGKGGT